MSSKASPVQGPRTAADVDAWGSTGNPVVGIPVMGIPVEDDFSDPRTRSSGNLPAQSPPRSSNGNSVASGACVLKIDAEDLLVMAQTFQLSENQVLAVWNRTEGNREATWRLLQEGQAPSERDAVEALKKVTIRRNTITISKQEITSLADMFGLPEDRVLAIVRMENGNMDAALAWMSRESTVAAADRGRLAPQRPAVASTTTVAPLPELQSFAEMFRLDLADVTSAWRESGGDRDKLLRELEFLASTKTGPRQATVPTATVVFDDEPNVELVTDDLFAGRAVVTPQRRDLPFSPGQRENADRTVSPGGNTMLPPMPGTS